MAWCEGNSRRLGCCRSVSTYPAPEINEFGPPAGIERHVGRLAREGYMGDTNYLQQAPERTVKG
jgi:hypothetical protein